MLNVIDPLLQAKQHENKIVYQQMSLFDTDFEQLSLFNNGEKNEY